MNYDSNSNINAFVSNNINKGNIIVKSFKMTGHTPPVIENRTIQNDNNINLGASSGIENRSIQNDNNINLGTPSVIENRIIQNDNNINLGVSSVIKNRIQYKMIIM